MLFLLIFLFCLSPQLCRTIRNLGPSISWPWLTVVRIITTRAAVSPLQGNCRRLQGLLSDLRPAPMFARTASWGSK
ncbi:hypothetical protein C8F01DRAFT_1157483 [Mycena amicta]|nr:hypothetical protein C8F01DRAFT_1157483 [Mycena amicta]